MSRELGNEKAQHTGLEGATRADDGDLAVRKLSLLVSGSSARR
jgi:hypothetical protein